MIIHRVERKKGDITNTKKCISYITREFGKNIKQENLFCVNCNENTQLACYEILETQARNTRAKSDKTNHYVVSFKQGELPPMDIIKKIEADIMKRLRYENHQRVCALHTDETDNVHLHIVVNKISPIPSKRGNYNIQEPYFDKLKLLELGDKLEKKYGLGHDNHKIKREKDKLSQSASTIEHQAGIESFEGYIKRNCFDLIKNAQTWDDLHSQLKEHNIQIKKSGRGIRFADMGDSKIEIKASKISREFSLENLEKRLGKYQEPPKKKSKKLKKQTETTQTESPQATESATTTSNADTVTIPTTENTITKTTDKTNEKIDDEVTQKGYVKQPFKTKKTNESKELFAQYSAEKETQRLSNSVRSTLLLAQNIFADMYKESQQKQLENEREKIQQEFSADLGLARFVKDPVIRMILIWLAKKAREKKMKELYQQQRAKKYSRIELPPYQKQKTWATWLQDKAEQGNQKALNVLQARESNGIINGNYIKLVGVNKQEQLKNFQKNYENFKNCHISKHGTLIVPVGKTTFRTDGEKIQLGYNSTIDIWQNVLQNLPNTKIEVNGSPRFIQKIVRLTANQRLPIVFADENLNRRKAYIERKFNEPNTNSNTGTREQRNAGFAKRNASVNGEHSNTNNRNTHGNAYGNKQHNEQFTERNNDLGTRSITRDSGNTAEQPTPSGTELGNTNDTSSNRQLQSNTPQNRDIPPPKFRNGLRALSQCDMVSFTARSEVLLQNPISNSVGNTQPKSNQFLRWTSTGGNATANVDDSPTPTTFAPTPTPTPPYSLQKEKTEQIKTPLTQKQPTQEKTSQENPATQKNAKKESILLINTDNNIDFQFFTEQELKSAQEYIAERHEKRKKGMKDILIHELFNNEYGIYSYKGARTKNNSNFLLLEKDNKIKLLPISSKMFDELKNNRNIEKAEISFTDNHLDIVFTKKEIKKEITQTVPTTKKSKKSKR